MLTHPPLPLLQNLFHPLLELPNSRGRYLSSRRTPLDLKRDHRVAPRADGQGVDGIYYVPGFVTKEEGRLLENAASSGDGGGGGPEWKELYKRRLQIHGGTPHPSGMVEEELPPFLREGALTAVEAWVSKIRTQKRTTQRENVKTL